MDGIELILLPIMLIGFFVAFFIQNKLHKYVSREKLLEVEDVTKLWKNSIPPKEVLNDKGLKLYRYFNIGIVVFIGGCFVMVAGGFLKGILTGFGS
jgi:hypothetical protein